MSNLQPLRVTEGAYLTLHYRLATLDGVDIVSTFHDNPATLQLGSGQLAPFLEERLIGLPEGVQETFDLSAEEAFGPRNPALIQKVSRATLDGNAPRKRDYAIGDAIEFAAPGGGRFAGVLCDINAEEATFDFNHPLAGKPIRFEVRIIGIL